MPPEHERRGGAPLPASTWLALRDLRIAIAAAVHGEQPEGMAEARVEATLRLMDMLSDCVERLRREYDALRADLLERGDIVEEGEGAQP